MKNEKNSCETLHESKTNSGLPQEATRNFRGVFAIDMLPKKLEKMNQV